jgi:polar amino acid transport system substrate-binding protein
MEKRGQLMRFLKIWLLVFFTIAMAQKTAHAEGLVLVAADSRPTAYMENGQPKGILVDVVTEAFRRSGRSVSIQLMPWARCIEKVRDGKVDGIFSVFRLPDREAFLAYSDVPVITQVEAFFVHKDSNIRFDGNLSNFSNLRVGVIRDTSYGLEIDKMMKDGIWRNVTQTNSVESLVSMLAAKRIDLSPSYRHVFLDTAKRNGMQDAFRELTPPGQSIPSFLAFNKKRDYAKTIVEFDKALTSMKADKSFDAIFAKYLN